MKSLHYPPALQELISQLTRLPSIGARGAERLALHLLRNKNNDAQALAQAISKAHQSINYCPQCGFFLQQGQECPACSNPQRNSQQICIVEQATDILPIERSGIYQGNYHCLGGKISPLDGIMPEDLRIPALLQRIRNASKQETQETHTTCEIILALSSDVEGEATALYLAELLKKESCTTSRLAQGMPAGIGLGNADTVTIIKALEGRQHY